MTASDGSAPVLVPVARRAPRVVDLVELTKPRITLLVVFTAFMGFYLGAGSGSSAATLVHTLVGTWLVAAAAAAMNEVYERDGDGLMRRTRERPLPAGRIDVETASAFAALLACAGTLDLALGANPLAALVALVTLAVYVGLYTPLKTRTGAALLVGAVPGALPPVIGWAASAGSLRADAFLLFGIVFLWQMPHFLAIAWLCREDYARAGIRVLTVSDRSGKRAGRQSVFYAVLLLGVSTLPFVEHLAGRAYLGGASVLGLGVVTLAVGFWRAPTVPTARRLFLASLVYLPLLCLLLFVD